jgi:hypothetical protein
MTIATPGDWVEVDLRATDDEMVRTVDERAQEIPQLAESRDQAIRLMRQVRDVSEEVGIVFAAAMFDVVEGVPVVASATVSVGPLIGIEGAGSEEDRLEAIATTMRASTKRVEELSIVPLQPGSAVRIQQLHEGEESPLGGSLASFSVQYLLPVAGEDTLVTITFATPTVALADGFVPLFDAIAATLELNPAS